MIEQKLNALLNSKKEKESYFTVNEIAVFFNVDASIVLDQITRIFDNNEIDENNNIITANKDNVDTKMYSLNILINVGYKVESREAIDFRRFATKTLKQAEPLQCSFANSTIDDEEYNLTEVLNKYSSALELLDSYDHQTLKKPKGSPTIYKLEYDEARSIIDSMGFNEASSIFGKEKEKGRLEGILLTIYQDVFGKELYPTTQEKAANLLYFLVKDHPFVDGCKRIAATLFLTFLNKNHSLIKDDRLIIDNKALAAITILTAESNPNEREMIVKLIMNLLR